MTYKWPETPRHYNIQASANVSVRRQVRGIRYIMFYVSSWQPVALILALRGRGTQTNTREDIHIPETDTRTQRYNKQPDAHTGIRRYTVMRVL